MLEIIEKTLIFVISYITISIGSIAQESDCQNLYLPIFSPFDISNQNVIAISQPYIYRGVIGSDIYITDIKSCDINKLSNSGINESPSWSPDGNKLVFSSYQKDKSGLVIYEYHTEYYYWIVENENNDENVNLSYQSPKWIQDSKIFAIKKEVNINKGIIQEVLCLIRPNSGIVEELLFGKFILGFTWDILNDGNNIYYINGGEIQFYDLTTKTSKQLTNGLNLDIKSSIILCSPDETKLMIVKGVGTEKSKIILLSLKNSDVNTIVSNEPIDYVDWSPDGNEILYSNSKEGRIHNIKTNTIIKLVIPNEGLVTHINYLYNNKGYIYIVDGNTMWIMDIRGNTYNQIYPNR